MQPNNCGRCQFFRKLRTQLPYDTEYYQGECMLEPPTVIVSMKERSGLDKLAAPIFSSVRAGVNILDGCSHFESRGGIKK